MHHRIDRIEDYEKQIKELEYKIKHERARLMETAKNWDIWFSVLADSARLSAIDGNIELI